MTSGDLSGLRGRFRVLVLYIADKALRGETYDRLAGAQSELEERAVVLVEACYPTESVAVLVGKDGGEKGRFPLPPDISAICRMIDSMPMRQAEMRRNAKRESGAG